MWFLGNRGTDKTHLAISLGIEVCKQNIKTRFYTFKELIELLTTSEEKGLTNKTLKQKILENLIIRIWKIMIIESCSKIAALKFTIMSLK
ncbi:ATP-binding protein [Staphylococcus pseudintermedius]|nr:ATP-binding protein [Staphylococcus pseudintermedius]